MSQCVRDDVDAERVGVLDGIQFEVVLVVPFPLPSIADVIVVANDTDHAVVGIVIREKVRAWITRRAFVSVFESCSAAPSEIVRDLRQLFEIVDLVEDFVV